MNKKAFEQENMGRAKFSGFCDSYNITPTFTNERFDRLDAYAYASGMTVGVEIKNRKCEYEKFPTLYIEEIKYNWMQSKMNHQQMVNGWFVYTFCNHLYLIDAKTINKLLNKKIIQIEEIELPIEYNSDKKIIKRILPIPKEYARLYESDSQNRWHRLRKNTIVS